MSTKTLVNGILAICFSALSIFLFGWISIAGIVCGIVAVVFHGQEVKKGNQGSVAGLVCGIIAIPVGAFAFIGYIYSLMILITSGLI